MTACMVMFCFVNTSEKEHQITLCVFFMFSVINHLIIEGNPDGDI